MAKYMIVTDDWEVVAFDGDEFNGYDEAVEHAKKIVNDPDDPDCGYEIYIFKAIEKFAVSKSVEHEKIE